MSSMKQAFFFFMPDSGIKQTNAAAYAACSEAYRLCEQYEAGIKKIMAQRCGTHALLVLYLCFATHAYALRMLTHAILVLFYACLRMLMHALLVLCYACLRMLTHAYACFTTKQAERCGR